MPQLENYLHMKMHIDSCNPQLILAKVVNKEEKPIKNTYSVKKRRSIIYFAVWKGEEGKRESQNPQTCI